MRVVMTNESGRDLPELFYDVDYTPGDRHIRKLHFAVDTPPFRSYLSSRTSAARTCRARENLSQARSL